MISKSLIATTAAAFIAVGALGLSATAASAHGPGPGQVFAPGYGQNLGKDFAKKHGNMPGKGWNQGGASIQFSQGGFLFNFGNQKVCSPVYGQKWDWHPWKGWVLKTVKVGEKCHWQPRGFSFGW